MATALVIATAALILAGCNGGQMDPITEQGKGQHNVYLLVYWVSVAVVLGVGAAIVFMPLRYRRKKNDDGELPEQYSGNNKIEAVWTIIPLILVIVIFALAFPVINNVQAVSEDPDLSIEVEGFQWQWRFTYPNTDVEVVGVLGQDPPTLVVPVDREINVSLLSNDVIHSFYVPDTLYKLDVVPGQTNEFTIKFTEKGRFPGQCAELCGLSHAQMTFWLDVVSPAEFAEFIAEAQIAADLDKFATATCTPVGSTATLTIEDGIFTPNCIAVVPDEVFDIELTNNDNAIQHNVEIYESRDAFRSGEDPLYTGAVFLGEGTEVYQVQALDAGQYYVVSENGSPGGGAVLNVGNPPVAADAAAAATNGSGG